MGFRKCFVLAIKSIFASKMRAFLTMLGVIIGVAAVIILVSLMDGLTNEVTNAFESLGTNNIVVSVTERSNKQVKVKEMEEFVESTDLISMYSPTVTVMSRVKNDTDYIETSVTGINEYYKDINDYTMESGRFINFIDVEKLQKVCVVGTYIKYKLFEGNECLGQAIRINGDKYTIIGVIEEMGDSSQTSSDNCIYIPYTLAVKINQNAYVGSYTLYNADDEKRDEAVNQINKFLMRKIGDEDYFSVTSMAEVLESLTKITNSMRNMLVAIAGISLLVGGIGIMNIMLVSVTERTREIGIRKSLGAKQRDIMSQFVIEAGTVSSIGGIIGIIIGGLIATGVGKLLDFTVYPSLGAVILAFSVSVGIGLLFGYLPAKKAARLNPIDALRYD